MRHLVSIDDLTLEEIERLLALADELAGRLGGDPTHLVGGLDLATGRILATLFHEPSTRTRLSFESAMLRLGGQVISAAEAASSSAAKGERIADTVRVVEAYAGAIVIRHPREGAARVAAEHARCPVINAGDGSHEHPTQTLTDLYTLKHEKGRLRRLTVELRGDLRYGRTVHSLVRALARLDATIVTAPAPGLELPEDLTTALAADYGCTPVAAADYDGPVDASYMTRLQKERLGADAHGVYRHLDAETLAAPRYRDCLLLHPLPRVDELDVALDKDPRAGWFRQAAYGVPARMALLAALLELESGVLDPAPASAPPDEADLGGGIICPNPACITRDPSELDSVSPAAGAGRCRYCGHRVEQPVAP
jgi:aspartate carbamoyltransferase catalytic subunit